MGAATLVPVEEYLSTSYDPDCDYVEGELEDRNVAELGHSAAQGNLYHYLRSHFPALAIFVELRVRISSSRYRVPDICVTLVKPSERILTQPPFLCIEIVSPEDRVGRIQSKIADYLKFGVRYMWLIDPQERDAFIYTATGMHAVEDGVLRTSEPDIAVPLSEVWG